MRELKNTDNIVITLAEWKELTSADILLKALKAMGVEQLPIYEEAHLYIKEELNDLGISDKDLANA